MPPTIIRTTSSACTSCSGRPNLGWPDDGAAGDAWAREAFQIVRVVANAHDGSIPPNQYRVGEGEALRAPLSILVERGSHAMAPDINRDGRFTPNIDNSEVSKVRWGIRDNGSTWRWYLQHFMDVRDASAVRLCGPVASPAQDPPACPRYSLYPADDLQRWFQELQLSARDREDVVGRTSWLVRTFGDFRVEHLMAPLDAADGREFEKMLRRRKVSETGFVAGFTTVDHTPALVLSRRYFWEVPSPRYPDILAEAVAIFPNDRRTLFEATVWGSVQHRRHHQCAHRLRVVLGAPLDQSHHRRRSARGPLPHPSELAAARQRLRHENHDDVLISRFGDLGNWGFRDLRNSDDNSLIPQFSNSPIL